MKRNTYRCMSCLLFLFFFISTGFIPNTDITIYQTEDDPDCMPLDVIFLVDQSDSMSGKRIQNGELQTFSNYANDPNDWRIYGPKAMIDLLSDFALLDQCEGVSHRISVISFGRDATVDLDLSVINPNSYEESRSERERLSNKIISHYEVGTDIYAGFKKARSVFEENDSYEDAERKKVIIVLTDGVPCPPGQCGAGFEYGNYVNGMVENIKKLFEFDENLNNKEKCLDELKDKYRDDIIPEDELQICSTKYQTDADVHTRSTYIYFVLMRDQAIEQPSYLKDAYEEIADYHSGWLVVPEQNKEQIPTEFSLILQDLSGIDVPVINCGSFAVNPYLERAILTFYKSDPESVIQLSYEDIKGNKHMISHGMLDNERVKEIQYFSESAYERYEIESPYPGVWYMDLEGEKCEGLDAYYQEVEINPSGYTLGLGNIPQYDIQNSSGKYYDEDNPYFIEYQMLNSESDVISQSEDSRFKIDVMASVTTSSGDIVNYPLEWDLSDDLFRSEEPIEVEKPGIYSVDILGTTNYHTGPVVITDEDIYTGVFTDKKTLFEHYDMEFDVYEVTPFQIKPVNPKPNEKIYSIHGTIFDGLPLPYQSLEIEAVITDRNGDKLSNILMDELFPTTDQPFSAYVKSEEGLLSDTILLEQDAEDPYLFRGIWNELPFGGNLSIVIEMTGEPARGYRPDDSKVEYEIERLDGFFNRMASYYLIAALIVLSITGMIIRYFLTHNNPVQGQLIFQSGEIKIAEFGLFNSKKNWRTITKKELKNYPQLNLKKVKVVNREKVKKGNVNVSSDDDFANEFSFNSDTGHPGIKVFCELMNGEKIEKILYPGSPDVYSSESVAEMIFEPM